MRGREAAALVGGAEDQDTKGAVVAGAPEGARGPRQVGEGAGLPQGQGAGRRGGGDARRQAGEGRRGRAARRPRDAAGGAAGAGGDGGQARLERDIDDIAAEYTLGGEFDFSVLVDVYPDLSTHLDEAVYSKLSVEVDDVPFNQEAYDAALRKLRDQHVDLIEKGAAAAMGDQLEANMNGYFATADGGKREPLPQVAGGESLQIEMKEGKFMHGLVEGLVGATDGETRSIAVTFPARSSAPQLAGKAAFRGRRDQGADAPAPGGERRVRRARQGGDELGRPRREAQGGRRAGDGGQRQQNTDVALSKALVELLPDDFEVPDTIVQEVTKERFAAMLADLRERGTPDEQLKDLITEERCVAARRRPCCRRPPRPARPAPAPPRPLAPPPLSVTRRTRRSRARPSRSRWRPTSA